MPDLRRRASMSQDKVPATEQPLSWALRSQRVAPSTPFALALARLQAADRGAAVEIVGALQADAASIPPGPAPSAQPRAAASAARPPAVSGGTTATDTAPRATPSLAAPAAAAPAPSAPAPAAPVPAPAPSQVAATPLVTRLAAQHGVELSTVKPTGAGGRVSKADVLAAAGVPEADIAARVARLRANGTDAGQLQGSLVGTTLLSLVLAVPITLVLRRRPRRAGTVPAAA